MGGGGGELELFSITTVFTPTPIYTCVLGNFKIFFRRRNTCAVLDPRVSLNRPDQMRPVTDHSRLQLSSGQFNFFALSNASKYKYK